MSERKTLSDLIKSGDIAFNPPLTPEELAYFSTHFGNEPASQALLDHLELTKLIERMELRAISTLLDQTPEDVDWLWENLIPQGRFIGLTGYMKLGKSTVLGEFVTAVLKGHPFLDFPVKQGPVIYLTAEEAKEDVVNRLRDFGVTEADPLWVKDLACGTAPNFYHNLEKIVRLTRSVLVTIDAFHTFTGVEDENDPTKVTAVLLPMVHLVRKTGTTVLLVHHDRKSGGEGGRSMRGSGQIFGLMDQALFLSKPEGRQENIRLLKVLGRYQNFAPGTLRLDYRDGRYVCEGLEGEYTLEARKRKVLESLNSPLTREDIAEATGLTPSIVRHVLKALEKDGKVQVTGEGKRNDPYRFVSCKL